MSDTLDRLRQLISEKSYDSALSLCDEALSVAADSEAQARAWRLRSYVHRGMNRYDLAVQDASAGLRLAPHDLALLLDRATSCIELGEFTAANEDLELLLDIEAERGEVFFGTTAGILRAICLTRTGQPERALEVCEGLDTEARMWALGRLWTREALVDAAQQGIQAP